MELGAITKKKNKVERGREGLGEGGGAREIRRRKNKLRLQLIHKLQEYLTGCEKPRYYPFETVVYLRGRFCLR